METITINKQNAEAALKLAKGETKKVLSALLGDSFIPRPVMERIKTFEDALSAVGATADQHSLLQYSGVNTGMLAAQAHLRISIIAKALNEGWQPDWTNSSEYKYYPWFNMEEFKSGVGLSADVCAHADSHSTVGSRLCFKSSELAEYAGTQFISEYSKLFTL
ncbi:MAG: hypothetical protein WC760_06340 [Bacteroidia bacterium]|jgi:hypothetical protein